MQWLLSVIWIFIENDLTSFLHEGEKVIQKLLPFGVIVQLVQLKEKTEVH